MTCPLAGSYSWTAIRVKLAPPYQNKSFTAHCSLGDMVTPLYQYKLFPAHLKNFQ